MAIALSVGVMCGWIPDFLQPNADYLSLSLTMAGTLANAFLLLYLTRTTTITRQKDILPVPLYLLTVTAFPSVHTAWRLQVAVLLLTSAVLIIHGAYRKENTAHDGFLATALVAIASLFVPQVIFFVPFVWLAYTLLRAMRLRTFLASLIALAVFGIYLALAVYLFGWECPYVHVFEWNETPMLTYWILLAFHIAFLVAAAVRIDRDSTTQQALLILLFLFFLPAATATLFFRQRDSLSRGLCFLMYLLFLCVSYALYYIV